MIAFVYYAIREIPADPPHKGILLFLGRRLRKVLHEGWQYLPLCPIIFNAVKVKVTKINQDLEEQIVKTPDLTDLGFKISITWTPGSWTANNEEQADLLFAFLNSGREETVKNILKDIIQDRLRVWAFSGEEGPADWEEAVGAKDEALAILIKAILGDDIPSIPSSIPTNVLLRYFNVPKKKPLIYQKKKWGKQGKEGNEWEGLEKELGDLSREERSALEEAVKKRQEIIAKVKQGNGVFVKRSLGITINRFTINEVVLKGKVAEAVEGRVVEKHQREAEKTELQHIRRRTKELIKEGFTREQAVEITQTERGKITKSVDEKKLTISPETLSVVEKGFQLFSK